MWRLYQFTVPTQKLENTQKRLTDTLKQRLLTRFLCEYSEKGKIFFTTIKVKWRLYMSSPPRNPPPPRFMSEYSKFNIFVFQLVKKNMKSLKIHRKDLQIKTKIHTRTQLSPSVPSHVDAHSD